MNKVGRKTDFSQIFAEKLSFAYDYDPEKQILRTSAENVGALLDILFNDERLAFDYLRDLTAKDQPPGTFHVVYNFLSFKHRHTLMVIAQVPASNGCELPEVESATKYYNSANWMEREVYDMFGIRFRNHPDLRRVFLDETVNFYPLRKSFYVEKVTNLADINEIEEAYRKMAEEQRKAEEKMARERGIVSATSSTDAKEDS